MYLQEAIDAAETLLDRWHGDPVLFAHEGLGIERLWPRQEEILRAVATYEKVAVKSGQKTSKTHSECIIAVWWSLTRPGSQVIVLAPSQNHLETVFWRQLAALRNATYDRDRSTAVMPLGGDFHVSPAAGWKFPNGSIIKGYVTNDPEKLRGVSGFSNLWILDEGTAIGDDIFASVDGNLAGNTIGGCLAISNPVHTRGWFYRCFADGSPWHQITISSIEASEVDPPISGLATKKFIAEKRTEWGEDSAEWAAKILGTFPPAESEQSSVIKRPTVDSATLRWTETPPDPHAPLVVGVDTAWEGGDLTVVILRRGKWTSTPYTFSKLRTNQATEKIVDVIRQHLRPHEKAAVHIDGTSWGVGIHDNLRDYHGDICTVTNLMAASSSPDPRCALLRDALWINLREWLRHDPEHNVIGGTISPVDPLLGDDLVTPRLGTNDKLKIRVEGKKEMKKRIGRSTDRADALALAVWEQRHSGIPTFGEWGTR